MDFSFPVAFERMPTIIMIKARAAAAIKKIRRGFEENREEKRESEEDFFG